MGLFSLHDGVNFVLDVDLLCPNMGQSNDSSRGVGLDQEFYDFAQSVH